jgi:phosphoribosyl 1,2-cyclic phosphodiesterase
MTRPSGGESALDRNVRLRAAKDAAKTRLRASPHDDPTDEPPTLVVPPLVHKQSEVDTAQQWYFNGFILRSGGHGLLVDPGVDFYSRFTQTGATLKCVRGLFVSHRHIDHLASVPALVDMLVKLDQEVDILVPEGLLDDGFLAPYLIEAIARSERVRLLPIHADGKVEGAARWPLLRDMSLVRLSHSDPNTYGFRIESGPISFSYVSDTGYARLLAGPRGSSQPHMAHPDWTAIDQRHDQIRDLVNGCRVVVVNINDLFYNRHSLHHLSGWDVADLLSGSGAEVVVLQHLAETAATGEDNLVMYEQFFGSAAFEIRVARRIGLEVPL